MKNLVGAYAEMTDFGSNPLLNASRNAKRPATPLGRLLSPRRVDAAGFSETARVAAPVAAAGLAIPLGHAFPFFALGCDGFTGIDGALQGRADAAVQNRYDCRAWTLGTGRDTLRAFLSCSLCRHGRYNDTRERSSIFLCVSVGADLRRATTGGSPLQPLTATIRCRLFQVSSFAIKSPGARMQWNVEGCFCIVGAQLAHVDRFEIVARDQLPPFLDRLAERVGDVVGQIGTHDHRPAAEIDRRHVAGHAVEARLRHHRSLVAHRGQAPQNLSFDRQIDESAVDRRLTPALDAFVEHRVDRAVLNRVTPVGMARTRYRDHFAAPFF